MVRKLVLQYKAIIMYGVFGILTTAVNILVYGLLAYCVQQGTVASTIWAWFVAVLFAYLTNRRWVFESKEHTLKGVLREMVLFFACRLTTGILDVVIMYVFVDMLIWNDMLIKIVSNVMVIGLNYVGSKLVIFKDR